MQNHNKQNVFLSVKMFTRMQYLTFLNPGPQLFLYSSASLIICLRFFSSTEAYTLVWCISLLKVPNATKVVQQQQQNTDSGGYVKFNTTYTRVGVQGGVRFKKKY